LISEMICRLVCVEPTNLIIFSKAENVAEVDAFSRKAAARHPNEAEFPIGFPYPYSAVTGLSRQPCRNSTLIRAGDVRASCGPSLSSDEGSGKDTGLRQASNPEARPISHCRSACHALCCRPRDAVHPVNHCPTITITKTTSKMYVAGKS
jgi:hypothetical protein